LRRVPIADRIGERFYEAFSFSGCALRYEPSLAVDRQARQPGSRLLGHGALRHQQQLLAI
jgi:hypothetical protein